MKIIINDSLMHVFYDETEDMKTVIVQKLKEILRLKEVDEKGNPISYEIDVDDNTGVISLNYNKRIAKIGKVECDSNKEPVIYLTTTEIKMLMRDSTVKINPEMVDTPTLISEVKGHLPEASDKVLELHTHFIEVLDGETFFHLLVEGDPYFEDPNNKGIYIVRGKAYTEAELIAALDYPMEKFSGDKERDIQGYPEEDRDEERKKREGQKTLAFSKLSDIVSIRTWILKRSLKDQTNAIFDKKRAKYGVELEQDSEAILIARIRELFVASIKKLGSEGVNYVELSYSRTDISRIFEEPEKVVEPIKPENPTKEELEEYNEKLKIYNKYVKEKEIYDKFIEDLEQIKKDYDIDYRFLLSAQRDDWRKPINTQRYFVPGNVDTIITKFLDDSNRNDQEKIIIDLISRFKRKTQAELDVFKAKLLDRINPNKKGKKKIYEHICSMLELNDQELLNAFKNALKNPKADNSRSCIVFLYNMFYEDMAQIDGLLDDDKSKHIVGYDIMGYETKMTNAEKYYLEQKIKRILKDYKYNDEKSGYSGKRIIRIHAGETRESSGNVLYVLQLINKIKSDPQFSKVAQNFEFRIGHGVFIFDEQKKADEVVRLLIELGVIVEVNLSSNYALDNVDEITQVPIQRFREGAMVDKHRQGVKYVVSTDGGGVYRTSILQEGLLEHRYFPQVSSTNPPKFLVQDGDSDGPDIGPASDPAAISNSDVHADTERKISEIEDDSDISFKQQVLNEFKNLVYIFYKDFSIDSILNFDEISSKMGDIEKSINSGNYIQAKMDIISCQILMNSSVNFDESLKRMRTRVNAARSRILNILNNEEVDKTSKIYATLRLINQMSDRDLLINYYNIFEKGDLNKILKDAFNDYGYSINNSSIDTNKLYNLTSDVNDIFFSNIKSKFAAMDDETIYKATDSLMLKDGEDKTAYIDNLLEMLNTIKHSEGEELSRLRNAILPLNLEQLRYELENKTISDINDMVRHLLVYDKTVDELSSILSLRYRGIVESGSDLSIEEFVRGEYGNDRSIKR